MKYFDYFYTILHKTLAFCQNLCIMIYMSGKESNMKEQDFGYTHKEGWGLIEGAGYAITKEGWDG